MSIALCLKVMSFLQYFIWGSWLVILGSYMINTLHFTGINAGMVYSSEGIAVVIMPGIVRIIADKWLHAKRIYMLYHLVCVGVLFYTASVTDPDMMFWMMLVDVTASMPTIALSNNVSYSCLVQIGLDLVIAPLPVHVSGTVGFIVAIWAIGPPYLELSSLRLHTASGTSLLLSAYALTLPKIPVAEKRATISLTSKLGLDAFVLFRNLCMTVFLLFAMMLDTVLQITSVFGNPFLYDFARNLKSANNFVVKYSSILLPVPQMTEVGFTLTISFFLRRFGTKTVMLIGMMAWVLCLGFFVCGGLPPTGSTLLLLSVIVYGRTFDFFGISGSAFVEQEVDSSIRASTQSLLMTMISDVGAWVGSILSDMAVDYFSVDGVED